MKNFAWLVMLMAASVVALGCGRNPGSDGSKPIEGLEIDEPPMGGPGESTTTGDETGQSQDQGSNSAESSGASGQEQGGSADRADSASSSANESSAEGAGPALEAPKNVDGQ